MTPSAFIVTDAIAEIGVLETEIETFIYLLQNAPNLFNAEMMGKQDFQDELNKIIVERDRLYDLLDIVDQNGGLTDEESNWIAETKCYDRASDLLATLKGITENDN